MKLIFNKLNISGVVGKIKKIPWILGSRAFLIILLLILLDLILGEFLLYKYAILVKKEEPEITGNIVKFEYGAYLKVLEKWQAKEQQFTESVEKSYNSPFTN